jgi:hypothetical protein
MIKPFFDFAHCKHNEYGYLERCKDCFRTYRKNYPEKPEPKRKPRTTDDGLTLLCRTCDQYKLATYFPKNNKSLYGRDYACLDCYRIKHPLSKPKRIITETHAECTKCKQVKPYSEFHKNKEVRCGLESRCRNCTNAQDNEYYRNKRREGMEQRRQQRHMLCKFNDYAKDAKEREYSFNLSLEQFWTIKRQPCVYCGQEPDPKKGNGIDRVDNDIGYEPDNCVPCCTICNLMKRALSLDDFSAKIKKIAAKIDSFLCTRADCKKRAEQICHPGRFPENPNYSKGL